MSNTTLWDAVCVTDPDKVKGANIGRMKITAIDPQYQRRRATEMFGPFGIGWGVKDEKWNYLDFPDNDMMLCHYTATFWYVLESSTQANPLGEFAINSNVKVKYKTKDKEWQGKITPGYVIVDDEYAKKAATDALTKGLSALGFNSDVFEGKYDDNKYVQGLRDEKRQKSQPRPAQEPQGGNWWDKPLEVLGKTLFTAVLGREGYEKPEDVPPEYQGNVLSALRAEAKAQ